MNDDIPRGVRCPHCPRGGLPCRGETAVRLCQLVDPAHLSFNPAYRSVLAPAGAEANDPNNPSSPNDPDDRSTTRNPPIHQNKIDREHQNFEHIPLNEAIRLTRLARGCPYRSPPSCGCAGGAACALKGGADVSASTCWDCIRRYGPP